MCESSTLLSPHPRSKLVISRYVVAVSCVAAAFFIRWLLDPLLDNNFAFLTMYGAVAVAVWYGGWRPALLAALLGFVLASYFFIPPRFAFVSSVIVWAGFLGYSLSCGTIIYLGEAVRRAKERLAADLIEREQVQERLRETEKQVRRARDYAEATLRTSPIPLLILQSDLRVVSGNEAFYELFKIDLQETIGRRVYELGNGEWNIPRLRELVEDILPNQDWFQGFEITHRFKNIGERTLLLNARRMEVEAGSLDRIVLAIEDVTERKRVEAERERLIKAEQELRHVAEEANRLKDEFLAIMSHELRNPLNVILGYSELLLRSEESRRSPELLRTSDAIKRNALIQARLIRDLLDLSRLRSGKISLNNERVSLLVAVNHAVETVRADANAKNIGIEVVVIDEPLFVQGDPVRLAQIVWNLLNNSVKFTPPSGRIFVRLDSKHDQACVTVRDTGQGIEPSFLPHVFEMFRQADARKNRPHAGMGIGLAVVHQLVDLHQGSIAAFSDGPGKGATFTLQLPLTSEPKTLPATALSLAATLNKLSILVVDDSKDTTEMLTTLLSTKGAEVIPATNGNEALQVIAEREFDVVLSDISMPEMDGFEFLKRLRQIPGRTDVPVLALTGFGRPEDIERAKAEGFFSHVTKPFELDALIGVLQRLPRKN